MSIARSAARIIMVLLLFAAVPGAGAQVLGSAWTSPTYGFTVSWAGMDWQVDPTGSLAGVGPERLDRLHLVNAASSLYFEGATRYQGDLAACVAEEANILSREPGVSDVRPYRDAAGAVVAEESAESSAAAFLLTLDVGGQALELADYVECRPLVADEAVLIVTLVTNPALFEEELVAAREVMETITLAGDVVESPLVSYGGLLAAAQERPSLAGPLSGEIAFGPGVLGVERAGVDVPDFYARIEFANPQPASLEAWDFGVGFRDAGGEEQMRLVVDSAGNWFLKNGLGPVIDQGTLVDVDASASGTNIIEIIAVGETGYFAFNERLVTELALPGAAGGDLFAGAGFFAEDATSDGITEFRDFEIWSLAGLDTGEPASPAATLDAATFAELAEAASATRPLAAPRAGELPQAIGAAATAPAGVEVENFVASATFVNPSNAADMPWDFGIAFREQENDDHYRITVASDGSWEFQIGLQPEISGGMLPALNYAEGARNTIVVVVDGATAGFSVNGVFVSSLDVSALSGASDVWVGSGFHVANAAEQAVTPFEDFIVWAIPGGAAATPELLPPPAPVATPVADLPMLIPREVALRLHETGDSGIDALAVLRDTDGRTAISIVARDAAGGEVVTLHEGTCEDLAAPLQLLEPLTLQGSSETTIDTPLSDLNDGGHAIAIHQSTEDDTVLACGTIPMQQ